MIQSSTLKFLKDIKKNNNRDWFAENKPKYEEAKKDVTQFMQKVIDEVAKFEPSVKGMDASKLVMRIYRDVRFSKDKSPYKINFGIPFSAKGGNVDYPGYYMHIQPGESFVGGGSWMPNADNLKMIRQEIDYSSKEFKKIVESASFKKTFGKLSEEDKLKTAPKDYPKDHPEIEYLKLKSFTAFAHFSDEDLTDKNAAKKVVEACKTLQPFIKFLQTAIEK
jgi:uncharacterized protein (TIGR02453 family)